MKLKTSILFFVCCFFVQLAAAQSWQFVGPRAMGMGGAGVATAYGPDAQYWNPAGLTSEDERNEAGLLLNAGATLETTGRVLEAVDSLADMSDKYKRLVRAFNNNETISSENITTLFEGLNNISKLIGNDMGAIVNGDAGIGFKFKNFAVSSRAIGTGAVKPVIDKENIRFYNGLNQFILGPTTTPSDPTNASTAQMLADAIDANGIRIALNNLLNTGYSTSLDLANALINAAAMYGVTPEQIASAMNNAVENIPGASEILHLYNGATGSYEDNETLAIGEAAAFGEFALGYGAKVIPGLKVGGNIKVISGYTAETGVMLLTDHDDFSDIIDKAKKNKARTDTWAVDLGALVNFSEMLGKDIFWNPQAGVTAHNINGPKFDRPAVPASFIGTPIEDNWNPDKYQLKPQVRAGISVNPKNWMTLAADIDVTENDTLLNGIKSRQLALGLEINLVNGRKFNMPLRFGYNKNLAESSLSPFYTAGIGFEMLHFFVEFAAAASNKTSKVDGNTVPNSAAASLTLGFLF